MRVTLLNTNDSGGAGVASRRLLAALRGQGTEAHLLLHEAARAYPGVVPLAFLPGERRLALARFALERALFLPDERDASVRWAFSPARIGADVSKHPLIRQAEVLHLHWVNFGFLSINGIGKLMRLGKPVVWTLHDMWPFTGGCHYSRGCERFKTHCGQCPFLRFPGERDLSFRRFTKKEKAYRAAPLTVVACSEWLAGLARQSTLFEGVEVLSIPNPIDTNVWQPTDRTAARTSLGLPAETPLLLFGAAKLADPRKGFDPLVEALHRLKTGWPAGEIEPELVVFGKSDPMALARVPFRVHDLGLLSSEEKLVAAYNAADALAVPSLEDNLPNTVMESLACGTPVVAFATGGIPEMIQHRKTGWLAPPGDVAGLAEGLNWIFSEKQPQALREAARAF
ncbi:MAG: glycosyltransferase family 4 protein, partial [Sphingobacteriaceae bacterium]|nr:glycosyltransferase family 4 protein [Cytophagaceae bacterium]